MTDRTLDLAKALRDRTRLSSMSYDECTMQPKSTNKALRNQQEFS